MGWVGGEKENLRRYADFPPCGARCLILADEMKTSKAQKIRAPICFHSMTPNRMGFILLLEQLGNNSDVLRTRLASNLWSYCIPSVFKKPLMWVWSLSCFPGIVLTWRRLLQRISPPRGGLASALLMFPSPWKARRSQRVYLSLFQGQMKILISWNKIEKYIKTNNYKVIPRELRNWCYNTF